MQETLFMRHWAENHHQFNADLARLARRGLARARRLVAIGPAYERWAGNHGPALLGGTAASIATTLLIGVAVTVLMPATPAAADPVIAQAALTAGLSPLA